MNRRIWSKKIWVNYVTQHGILDLLKSFFINTVSVEPSVLESKSFLDTNIVESWDDVKCAWVKTQELRKNDLKPAQRPGRKRKNQTVTLVTTEDFFKKWSSLKTTLGYELIQLDFDAWYPEASKITERKLDQLVHKLSVRRLQCTPRKKRRFQGEITAFKTLIDSDTTDPNVKVASKIEMLAYLLSSTGRANANNHTTAINIFNSMILYAQVRNTQIDRILFILSKKSLYFPNLFLFSKYFFSISQIFFLIFSKYFLVINSIFFFFSVS